MLFEQRVDFRARLRLVSPRVEEKGGVISQTFPQIRMLMRGLRRRSEEDFDHPARQRLRLFKPFCRLQQPCEIVASCSDMGVLRPESLFKDRERAATKQFRPL